MNDYIIRATAANDQIRAFAAVTTQMVETAREHHNTSPVATAALGRLLTAGAMMGAMMKGEKDVLTLQIKAGGPLQGFPGKCERLRRQSGCLYPSQFQRQAGCGRRCWTRISERDQGHGPEGAIQRSGYASDL